MLAMLVLGMLGLKGNDGPVGNGNARHVGNEL